MNLINNIKSSVIKGEIKKSLSKLDTSLLIPALDNIMESIGIVVKDRPEIRQAIANKLMELIRELNGTSPLDKK